MDVMDIKAKFESELLLSNTWNNWHGLNKDNVSSHIVEPYPVLVDPDDLETPVREMFVVLNPPGQYLLAFDFQQNSWAIIEHLKETKYIQVIAADTVNEVLDGM